MATFLMLGKYSSEALKSISAARTDQTATLIKKLGGSVEAMYTVLGPYDVILIVDLPGTNAAMQASIEISKLTNIAFTTSPAITVEKFDAMMG